MSARRHIALLLVLLLLAACTSDSDRKAGIEEVDAVIAIVESGDVDAILELLQLQTLGCTHEIGQGGPPKCAPGETEGDLHEVFEFYVCTRDWLPRDWLDIAVTLLVDMEPTRYSVFRPVARYLFAGPYVAMFEGVDTRMDGGYARGAVLNIAGGEITGIWLGCGVASPVDEMLPRGDADYLLGPLN